ncbi:MAG: FKBP-type peptidyl-prolyl cis-trans isomerase [Clostridia bacterium]|nr:FKBP-type peptidyl-prolyl cis-trans isomerase [Clostridia bacterium]
MKKLFCLLLAVCMCATLFAGCGKFDMENADVSDYVDLCDISDIPYENLVKAYEEYREVLSEDMKSCALSVGYTIDFFVKAELLDAEGKVVSVIDAWTHNTEEDMVKGYDVYRNPSDFDHALIYNVAEAGQTSVGRTVEIGKDFSFNVTLDQDYEDETLAGKKVKFTVNVKKALPAVYPDSYISERLNEFYKAVKTSKAKIELGDTVTIDFKGTIDGVAFEGGTGSNYLFVAGESNLLPEFENQLMGHALNEKFTINVTFPEDYGNQTLAGKTAEISVQVKDIYNDLQMIRENTTFKDMWELKYALRVESYISYALVTYTEERSELIAYPEKLLKNFEKIFKSYVARDVAEKVLEYAEQGYSYTKKEMKKLLYPDGSDKTYITEGAKAAAYSYLIAVAIQRELGLSYTEQDYETDLKLIAEEYTAYYGETYTAKDIVSLYGEEVLRTSFLVAFITETLTERISGAPEIPG